MRKHEAALRSARRAITSSFLLAFLLLAAFSAPSQEHNRVQIEHLSVPEGESQLQTVSKIVTDTIALSLRLMGDYEVVYPGKGDDAVRSVGGRCFREDDGSLHFHLYVIDLFGGDVLFEMDHVAESIFDIFDVADEAVLALLEKFKQQPVRFGSLRIEAGESQLPYSLTLNGEIIAADRFGRYENSRIVEGLYELTVIQNRLPGPVEVHQQKVEIRSDQATEVALEVEPVVSAEKSWLQEHRVGSWIIPDGESVLTPAADVNALKRELAESGRLPSEGALRRFIDHAAEVHDRVIIASTSAKGAPLTTLDRKIYPYAAASRDTSESPFAKVFPGTVEQFVREQVTEIERFWETRLSVHVSSEGVFLGMSLSGISGAERVRVSGPPGSGIRNHLLKDGGRISPYGNGVYDDYLVDPASIKPGDQYQFHVERLGTTTTIEAKIRPFATEIVSAIDVSSTSEGYLVEWTQTAAATSHTVVVSAANYIMPAPSEWQWSANTSGDAKSMVIPREELGSSGERRVHLFSADKNGNRVWAGRSFIHQPYN